MCDDEKQSRYISAAEAASRLAVTVPTIYAYVSRGMIRSQETPGERQRRYLREDVEALRKRKEERRRPERVAETALSWGRAVLESGITGIAEERLYYRGRDACTLSRAMRFEQVASHLWQGGSFPEKWAPMPALCLELLPALLTRPLIDRCRALLALAEYDDPAASLTDPASVRNTGVRIVRLLACCVTGRSETHGSLAEHLERAWIGAAGTPALPASRSLIDAALILCADHELNASTFTARCAASTGASPYNAVVAGLAALAGPRHGLLSERAAELLEETAAGNPAERMATRLRRGEDLPGFGHPLYPQGDPRAAELLARTQEHFGGRPAARHVHSVLRAAERLVERKPTVDFALAALAHVLELPRGAPVALFALGRSAGWIAHASEQYATGELIRPRARYVGPSITPPGSA